MSENKKKSFLEIAKENGKVKDIKEAFREYPVEEEWHQGKIENIIGLREESQEYYLYTMEILYL